MDHFNAFNDQLATQKLIQKDFLKLLQIVAVWKNVSSCFQRSLILLKVQKVRFLKNLAHFELNHFVEKKCFIFANNFENDLNFKRNNLYLCWFKISFTFVWYDLIKKPLSATCVSFFRLQYLHNQYYKSKLFLLGYISYILLYQ